jgi:hypothetical protein
VFKEAFPPDAPGPNGAPPRPDGRQRERDAGFARRFLTQGTLAEADPAERFVLLRFARDFAARGGDSVTAMRAVRKLSDLFGLPPLETRDAALTALAAAGESAESAEAVQDNARALQQLIEAALAVGDDDLAARAVAAAKPVASRSKDPMLQSLLQSVTNGNLLAGLDGERAAAAKATEKLRSDPADAEANATAGAFLCFARGDWQAGLPRLAKSSNATWKELAAKDTATDADAAAKPVDAGGAMALAEAWQQAASDHAGREKEAALRRSAFWSLRAMPESRGPAFDAARGRLDALRDSVLRPGLLADLYDGEKFERHHGTRIDATIDFDWGEGAPDARLGVDHFSLCWQGYIQAPKAGKYELESEADDGVIVRLEGRQVIDEWHTMHNERYHATVDLTGRPQAFEVMYYEITGAAMVRVRWKPPGAEQFVPIPPGAFSHDPVWPWGPTALATRPRPVDAVRLDTEDKGGTAGWLRKYPDQLPWHAAQRRCEQMGGHLAWVRRAEDEEALKKLADTWSVWLGGSDDEIENRWEWTNGVRIDPDLFDWWEGEPNGGRNENYLSILEGKGWNDSGEKMPFICQWEPPERRAFLRPGGLRR